MTPEQMRIAIAESFREHCPCKGVGNELACNWNCPCGNPVMSGACEKCSKDFFNDLNACAEFEATLGDEEKVAYCHRLFDAVNPTSKFTGAKGYYHCQTQIACATAPQRCEAYLRTKALWTEEPDKCPHCLGSGDDLMAGTDLPCPECHGTGEKPTQTESKNDE